MITPAALARPALTLAQSAPGTPQKQVLIWVGVLLVVAAIGGVVMFVLRRRMFDKASDAEVAGSLMEQLRELRRRGELSDAEFERARRSLSDKVVRAMDAKKSGPPDQGDRQPRDLRERSPSRARPTRPPPEIDARQAPPGFDLTGEPLPKRPPPE